MTGGLKIKSKTECLDTRQNALWCRNYSILHDIKIVSDLICKQNSLLPNQIQPFTGGGVIKLKYFYFIVRNIYLIVK